MWGWGCQSAGVLCGVYHMCSGFGLLSVNRLPVTRATGRPPTPSCSALHALAFDTIILALQCLLPLLSADQIAVRQILCKVSRRIWTATADCNRCTCLECAFIIASNIDIDVHFRRTTLQLMALVPLEVYDGTCSYPCTR